MIEYDMKDLTIQRLTDRITERDKRIADLGAALQPFADVALVLQDRGAYGGVAVLGPADIHCDLDWDDFARAAAAVAQQKE